MSSGETDLKETVLTVPADGAGLPVDRVLTRCLADMTRAKVRALFDGGRITVNGQAPPSLGHTLSPGDLLTIGPPQRPAVPALQILHQDASLVVLLKPAGLPTPRQLPLSLAPGRAPCRSPARLLYSLDDAVSGVLVAASHPRAFRHLMAQFSGAGGSRSFVALVERSALQAAGTQPGVPGWSSKIMRRFRDHDLIRVVPPRPLDARILAALASAGLQACTLPGRGPRSLAVHCGPVSFAHPWTGRMVTHQPPLPAAFKRFLDELLPAPVLMGPAAGPAVVEPDCTLEPALRSPREILRTRPLLPGRRR